MANQNFITDVKAAAFITATANCHQDFEVAKQVFKEILDKKLQQASATAKVKVLQEAVQGFTLQVQPQKPKEPEYKKEPRWKAVLWDAAHITLAGVTGGLACYGTIKLLAHFLLG